MVTGVMENWSRATKYRVEGPCTKRPHSHWGWNMGSLLLIVSITFIWVLAAALVGRFAERKGHSENLWNVFSLICSPLIGYLFVALLPSASELAPRAFRHCPRCSRDVLTGLEICPYCHADMSDKPSAQKVAA
jgi:hypothetical protein